MVMMVTFNRQTSDHIIVIKIHLIEDQWLILSSSRYPGNSNYLTHYKRWKSFWSLQIQFFSFFMEILYTYFFPWRYYAEFPCNFDLRLFPFDEQSCPMEFKMRNAIKAQVIIIIMTKWWWFFLKNFISSWNICNHTGCHRAWKYRI